MLIWPRPHIWEIPWFMICSGRIKVHATTSTLEWRLECVFLGDVYSCLLTISYFAHFEMKTLLCTNSFGSKPWGSMEDLLSSEEPPQVSTGPLYVQPPTLAPWVMLVSSFRGLSLSFGEASWLLPDTLLLYRRAPTWASVDDTCFQSTCLLLSPEPECETSLCPL
jgi:hypothetical protein